MIVGGVLSGLGNLFNNANTRFKFKIYDMSATTVTTANALNDALYLSFDGYVGLNYANNVVIPQQSLENRDFSNDSIIDNPFRLSITAVLSQYNTNLSDVYANYTTDIVSTLEYLLKSNALVVIFKVGPMFATYTNMHLESWNYAQRPDNTALFAVMNFREIRTNYTPNDNIDQNVDGINTNNTFSGSDSTNPANASNIDNGIINPVTPTGDTTNIGQPSSGVLF